MAGDMQSMRDDPKTIWLKDRVFLYEDGLGERSWGMGSDDRFCRIEVVTRTGRRASPPELPAMQTERAALPKAAGGWPRARLRILFSEPANFVEERHEIGTSPSYDTTAYSSRHVLRRAVHGRYAPCLRACGLPLRDTKRFFFLKF